MADPKYTRAGKQVLRHGRHFADAAQEWGAAEIVDALNRAHGTQTPTKEPADG